MKIVLLMLVMLILSIMQSYICFSVNSALHLLWVAKLSTSFGWGKGWKVTTVGWQLTLCDPIAVW